MSETTTVVAANVEKLPIGESVEKVTQAPTEGSDTPAEALVAIGRTQFVLVFLGYVLSTISEEDEWRDPYFIPETWVCVE